MLLTNIFLAVLPLLAVTQTSTTVQDAGAIQELIDKPVRLVQASHKLLIINKTCMRMH